MHFKLQFKPYSDKFILTFLLCRLKIYTLCYFTTFQVSCHSFLPQNFAIIKEIFPIIFGYIYYKIPFFTCNNKVSVQGEICSYLFLFAQILISYSNFCIICYFISLWKSQDNIFLFCILLTILHCTFP